MSDRVLIISSSSKSVTIICVTYAGVILLDNLRYDSMCGLNGELRSKTIMHDNSYV